MTRDSSELSDSALTGGLLWEFFPELRGDIDRLKEEESEFSAPSAEAPEVGAYYLISEIFIGGALSPLLTAMGALDSGLAKRCADFLEGLLSSERPSIKEMVSIRVSDHLLGYPENWARFKGYAGVLMNLEIRSRGRYYKDPFGVFESSSE
ncbi:hypothetical protein AB0M11_39625 [Streptomyces sp. NPDC051987]|uniref:hypothetical protein n=1 Tax=Streptomyces sp. NPDC051987 TaxID=3155808 RepID=UPI00343EA955